MLRDEKSATAGRGLPPGEEDGEDVAGRTTLVTGAAVPLPGTPLSASHPLYPALHELAVVRRKASRLGVGLLIGTTDTRRFTRPCPSNGRARPKPRACCPPRSGRRSANFRRSRVRSFHPRPAPLRRARPRPPAPRRRRRRGRAGKRSRCPGLRFPTLHFLSCRDLYRVVCSTILGRPGLPRGNAEGSRNDLSFAQDVGENGAHTTTGCVRPPLALSG